MAKEHSAENSVFENSKKGLIQYKEHLSDIIENMPALITAFLKDGTIFYCNSYTAGLAEKTAKELIGVNMFSLIDKEAQDSLKKKLDTLDSPGKTSVHTQKFTSKNGDIHYYEWRNKAYFDENGKLMYYIGIGTDTTERYNTQKALNESEIKYKNLFDYSPLGIGIADIEGKITAMNKTMMEITGFTNEDIQKNNVINSYVNPEDRDKIIDELKEHKIVKDREVLLKRKNGRIYNALLNLSLIDIDGKRFIMTNTSDITEDKKAEAKLKESEKRYRKTLDNMLEGCMLIGYDWTYIYMNDVIAQHAGFKNRDMIMGKKMTDLFPGVEKTKLYKYYEKCMKGRSIQNLEVDYVFPDNSVRYFRISARPVPEGIFVVSIDITESVKAARSLNNLNRTYAFLSRINQMILRTESINELYRNTCEIAVDYGKFKMAWIILYDKDKNDFIPYYWYGEENGYIEAIKKINLEKNSQDKGPVTKCITTGEAVVINDIESNPEFRHWKDEALKRGFNSLITIPFNSNERIEGVVIIYSDAKDFFDEKEVELLETLSDNISFAIETFRNNEEKEIANENLKRSESRVRNLIESTKDWVWELDLEGKYVYSSYHSENTIGYKTNEILGRSIVDFIVPEDREGFRKSIKELKANPKPFKNLINRNLHKNGKVVYLESSGVPVYDNSLNLVGYTGMDKDITDRINAKNRLMETEQMLSEAEIIGNSGSWTYEVKTGIYRWSDNLYNMLECSAENPPEYEYIRFVRKYVHPEDREFVLDELRKKLENHNYDYNIGYRIVKRDGSTRYVHAKIKSILNDSNEVGRLVGWIEDITKQKSTEIELIAAKEKSEEMSRLKSYFLAAMSHELRTPMVAILGFSELLQDSLQDPEEKHLAKLINAGGKRLTNTLNLILDLSRIEAGRVKTEMKAVDISTAAESVLTRYRNIADKKGIKLVNRINENIAAHADPELTEKITEQILENALKYTEKGEITIRTGYENVDGEESAFIKIADTGIGIPEDMKDDIFEPFRQVSEGYSRKFEGTGLGLSISKKYAELMGGSITVESKIGTGSEFTIRLKAHDKSKQVPENPVHQEPDTNNDKQSISYSGKKVLIVEDDELNLKLVKETLKNIFDCDFATNGEDAVEMSRNKRYDLFIMDIGLKGINGIDALKEIKKLSGYEHTPAIAVTAFAMEGDNETFLNNGFTCYLSKPFEVNELKLIARKQLGLV